MPYVMKEPIKISTTRIVFVYLLGTIWSAAGPLETFFKDGVVEQSEITIALLSFITGVVTITITLLLLIKRNRSLAQSRNTANV